MYDRAPHTQMNEHTESQLTSGLDRIAIIGMGCRFPGAEDPAAFWQMLKDGVDAVSEVPADRWSLRAFYDPDTGKHGKLVTRCGGFLPEVDRFDAAFFGISPREAACMDPQQRLLLEVSWEAMEDAGLIPEQLAGQAIGVFIGGFTLDYKILQLGARNRELIEAHTATGSMMTMLSNRISYAFDFRGPSASVDTACSSSLVAVHLACQSLRNGDCRVALAGGVNVMTTPEYTIAESKGGFLSPDGRSKAFDARANGYVRGEGAGVVILKPLADALRDGDPVYAVIRATAVNQDGRSNGITVPRREAQEALIREAFRRAGVRGGDIQYVEAHGTGTPVGDPIEANALGTVLSEGRAEGSECIVGSVKTNIGHLEAAAGIAGLIKASLCLKNRAIPPNLHFTSPNPQISFDRLRLRVPTAFEPWPRIAGPLLASVNSFGFGGTNAHAVIEAAPAPGRAITEIQEDGQVHLLPVSARSVQALEDFARGYRDFLKQNTDTPLRDICYSASAKRSHHDYRLAVSGRSHDELAGQLEAFLAGEARVGIVSGRRPASGRPKLAFVFTGMGPQWWAMGRELYAEEPAFREALEHCDEAFRRETGWPVLAEMLADEASSRMAQPQVAQTANFAIQMALAELWRARGVTPDAIVGHSVGEVAAAYVSGSLSLEDAVRVSFHRSRLQQKTDGLGTMLATGLPVEDAEAAIAGLENRISIAAVNSPTSTTLSGERAALEQVAQALAERRVFHRFLKVNVAYHSCQMDPLESELMESLRGLAPRPAALPVYSTVTGGRITGSEFDGSYWWANVRQAVRFRDAADRLVDDGCSVFLEVGPHPVLASSIAECLSNRGEKGHTVHSLRRAEPERATFTAALGTLYALGCAIDWTRMYAQGGGFVRLPAYPWQRERHWLESEESRDVRLGRQDHPLLGRRLRLPEPAWECEISRHVLGYLSDHSVQGAVVFPGAGYVEMGLAAARQHYGEGHYCLEEITFRKALFLPQGASPKAHVLLSPECASFEVHSQAEVNGAWNLHATGKVRLRQEDGDRCVDIQTVRSRCRTELSQEDCYSGFRDKGFQYGPAFQRITRLWRGFQEACAEIDCSDTDPAYSMHPAVLDACFQALIATDPFGLRGVGEAFMPVGIERVRVFARPQGKMWSHARLVERNAQVLKGDITLFDADGRVAAEIEGFKVQSLEAAESGLSPEKLERCFYEPAWQLCEVQAEARESGAEGLWLILADKGGTGAALARSVQQRGGTPVLVLAQEFDPDRLAAEMSRESGPAPRAVVHLWGLDAAEIDEANAAALVEAQNVGCIAVMNVVQKMVGLARPPRLWIVTRGAQAVSREPKIAAAQAMLWGMGRVIGNQEHVGLWGGLIDLDPAGGDETDRVIEEILNPAGEEVAFRNGQRYISRLVRAEGLARAVPPHFRPDGAYLITGGLGALGLLTARWMVRHGARRLILMGRSSLPARAAWAEAQPGSPASDRVAEIRELEAMGASITVAAVDVADEDQLTAFLNRYRQEGWPAIRGVVHSAGVVADQLLAQMTADGFRRVLAPKVAGALLLHKLLQNEPLDFFLLFSSVGSVVASAGQANYAAGNAFLDAVAHHRRARGLPAMSVNWGPWAVGMVRELDLIAHYAQRGMEPITPAQGVQMLDRIFGQNHAQLAALSAEWPLVFEHQPVVPAMILHLGDDEEQAASGQEAAESGASLFERLRAADAPERQALVEDYLQELTAKVLRLDRSKLDSQQPLNTLGMDSMMASELKNRIEAKLNVALSVVDLLQGLTIAELAAKLVPQIDAQRGSGEKLSAEELEQLIATTEDHLIQDMLAEIEQLSEDNARTMLGANE